MPKFDPDLSNTEEPEAITVDDACCEVLVVGAGPAGAACAMTLAGQGVDVMLVDQHFFPRDKVCGDALIPDALNALRRLGVLEQVLAEAERPRQVRCVAPSGLGVNFDATLAVLPRRRLDQLLVEEAMRRGVRFRGGLRFVQAMESGSATSRVEGAWFQPNARTANSSPPLGIRAGQTVLATGASASALLAAGMAIRRAPSALAARVYVKLDSGSGDREETIHGHALQVVWHRDLTPGYGWIFRGPGGIYNLGVGTFQRPRQREGAGRNLRTMFDNFLKANAAARRLLGEGSLLGPLKGAPLRSTLAGARWWRPGLLVCGEAAGSTYDFTGEGIGKALETGLLAADAIVESRSGCAPSAEPGLKYAAGLEGLRSRFELYEQGNLINRRPWIAELLVRLAWARPPMRRHMALLLEERITPDALLSARTLVRMMWARSLPT